MHHAVHFLLLQRRSTSADRRYRLIHWRVHLLNLTALLLRLNKDRKLFHILQLISTTLTILKLASNIRVPVTEEHLFIPIILGENFDVDLRKRFVIFIGDLQFAVAFEDLHI